MDEPRKFCGNRDFEVMCNLLVAGRSANNGTYYIHQGDLKWWFYYPPFEEDHRNETYLWEQPSRQGELLGWALISKYWVGLDVYVTPDLRGSPEAEHMYRWAEHRAAQIAQTEGKRVHWLWIRHDDEVMVGYLRQRGYQCSRGYVHLRRNLDGTIPSAELANGWRVRSSKGVDEVAARARAQAGAFHSSVPFERYLERFTRFMQSQVYDPELDVVSVSEEGAIGAFCIVWTDPINQVGLFEPVGTHPGFQRQGFGRAVMMEGLRRLKDRGMKSAIVSTEADNMAAIKLYESAGFQMVTELGIYEKEP
jgi:mycothiol synthase